MRRSSNETERRVAQIQIYLDLRILNELSRLNRKKSSFSLSLHVTDALVHNSRMRSRSFNLTETCLFSFLFNSHLLFNSEYINCIVIIDSSLNLVGLSTRCSLQSVFSIISFFSFILLLGGQNVFCTQPNFNIFQFLIPCGPTPTQL